ncbi:MAG TPA: hypothetical protein PLK06_01480 [bacterium]|nr:hypothetical protein [bacterium]
MQRLLSFLRKYLGEGGKMICPICGATDHKVYSYKGSALLACPQAEDNKITFFSGASISLEGDNDPGYCGISGIETGPLDPWHLRICKPHDDAYNRLKAGDDDGGMRVAGKFVGGVLKGMAEGAWMLVTGPFYLVFGGIVGGLVRFGQLERRGKVKPKGFLRGDPNDHLGE